MSKLSHKPHKVITHKGHGDEAWFYENEKSIDVYCYSRTPVNGMSCRIRRAVLEDWLKRTRKTK